MRLIKSTKTHEFYESYFNGNRMRLLGTKDKRKLSICTDDFSKAMEMKNFQEIAKQDKFLDCLNKISKNINQFPIERVDGLDWLIMFKK